MREALRGMVAMVRISVEASRWRSVIAFVLTPASQALFSFNALFLALLTDAILSGDRRQAMVTAGAIALAIGIGSAMALVSFVTRMGLQERTDLVIDQRLISLTSGIPTLEHHERPEYLDRLELLRTHRSALNQVIGGIVFNLSNLAQITVTAILLVKVHPLLILLPLTSIPSLWVTARTQKRIEVVEKETAEESRRALHLFDLGTSASAGKELRIFGLQPLWRRRYRNLWQHVEGIRTAERRRAAFLRAGGWTIFAVGYTAGLLLVVREAAAGRASPGEVLMAMTLAGRVNREVAGIAGLVTWLLSSLETVGRFLWLSDYAAERSAAIAEPEPAPDRLTDGIRLEGVAFSYPDTGHDILRDVSLHLPAGTTVAVVGENGAGKSTLIKLLCGFYAPSEGQILVDGVDLQRIPLIEWRQRMAAGFQDFARFEVQAGETVGVGDLARLDDEAAVLGALERAGGTDVIEGLSDGLATQVGATFDGVDLSGGQWQKLALGRAMMREAPLLLVLDEPTSSLDAETEHALFERYAEAARLTARATGTVTVLVSHRFSTVRMADLIVVVDGGRVTEVGDHGSLVAAAGLYSELYELQARAYR